MFAILLGGVVSAQVYESKTISGTTYTWDNPVVTDGTTSWTAVGDYIAQLEGYFTVAPTALLTGPDSEREGSRITFTTETTGLVAPITYQWRTIIGQYNDLQDGVRDTNWILNGRSLTWIIQPGFIGGDHTIVVGATGANGGSVESTHNFTITAIPPRVRVATNREQGNFDIIVEGGSGLNPRRIEIRRTDNPHVLLKSWDVNWGINDPYVNLHSKVERRRSTQVGDTRQFTIDDTYYGGGNNEAMGYGQPYTLTYIDNDGSRATADFTTPGIADVYFEAEWDENTYSYDSNEPGEARIIFGNIAPGQRYGVKFNVSLAGSNNRANEYSTIYRRSPPGNGATNFLFDRAEHYGYDFSAAGHSWEPGKTAFLRMDMDFNHNGRESSDNTDKMYITRCVPLVDVNYFRLFGVGNGNEAGLRYKITDKANYLYSKDILRNNEYVDRERDRDNQHCFQRYQISHVDDTHVFRLYVEDVTISGFGLIFEQSYNPSQGFARGNVDNSCN